MYISLEGLWQVRLDDGTEGTMLLPGTLDENGLGHRDLGAKAWHPDQELGNAGKEFKEDAPIATRFTRKHTFEGEARLTRQFKLSLPEGKRVFLEAERARVLRLLIDGREVPAWRPGSISTPYVFEVTGLLEGEHEVELVSDNSYPGLPHDAIVYSSAATDETQTNWNGVLGYLRLRVEERAFLSGVSVYPEAGKLQVRVRIASGEPWKGRVALESEALREKITRQVEIVPRSAGNGDRTVGAGRLRDGEEQEIVFEDLPLAEGVRLWDEEEGNLYKMKAIICARGSQDIGTEEDGREGCWVNCDEKTIIFGIRSFGDDGSGRLALNGRRIFLRSEANCGEFPETGHPPMSMEEWEEILLRYRSYGVNCVRFHSHCPPEAAFGAADKLGMLMQPELSHWNPRDAFESQESYDYYRTELAEILRMLANHPSFVMLTFGNELHAGELGHERMDRLLELAHSLDGTRLFANGSNVHYGWAGCDAKSDFYTATGCREADIRGTFAGMKGYINQDYPGAGRNFDQSMEIIRREFGKPVFSFEVGQFEVLPDFSELDMFRGISDPANLRLIQKKVKERGLEEKWPRYVEATGELALLGYREEVEAAMRTRELSGISLLGLQDFPGQGTALVGMMNSHLEPKPYAFAKPERFRAFFRDSLPLLLLEKYTYETGEVLRAEVLAANFGKEDVEGEVRYWLRTVSQGCFIGQRECAAGDMEQEKTDGLPQGACGGPEEARRRNGTVVKEGSLGRAVCPRGRHSLAGSLEISLDFAERPEELLLTVQIGKLENSYPIWVYPPLKPLCPEGIYETECLDEKAREILAQGGKVYLTPRSDKEHLPQSIQAQFTTDFWSVGTFSDQEGGMGQLIDAAHPIFGGFPTQSHTNWQWWAMATQRAVILPRPMECIIAEMDSYAYLRPMAQLVEFRCGGGKVLLSSMGLQNLQQYPEARALLASVYAYLASEEFAPKQELEPEEAAALVKG